MDRQDCLSHERNHEEPAPLSIAVGLVLTRASRLVLVGVGIGLAGAWGVGRLMASLLFEVDPTDVATFVSAPLALILVALLAAFLPARRASRVDPMEALRYE